MTKKNIIGLTGPSGSGKSQAIKFLNNFDIFIIDADKVAHTLLSNNQDLIDKIIKNFSNKILDDNNMIDRKKLGSIVFSDKKNLALLNQIIFPYIKLEIFDMINSCKNNKILIDAPTLIQSGLYKICDKIIVILASKDIRLKRIISRDNLSLEEATNRLDSQLSDSEYLKKADFVIYNNSDLFNLKKNIFKIFERDL